MLLDLIRTNRQLQVWRRLLLSKANRTWLVVASPQKKQWLITKHLPSPPSSTKAKVIYWLSVCLQKWLGQFSKSCAFSTDLYDYQSWYKSEDTGDIIVRKWNHEFSASYVVYCTAFYRFAECKVPCHLFSLNEKGIRISGTSSGETIFAGCNWSSCRKVAHKVQVSTGFGPMPPRH